jgi:hypothetical protein
MTAGRVGWGWREKVGANSRSKWLFKMRRPRRFISGECAAFYRFEQAYAAAARRLDAFDSLSGSSGNPEKCFYKTEYRCGAGLEAP